MVCGKCGARMRPKSKFCGECGTALIASTHAPVPSRQEILDSVRAALKDEFLPQDVIELKVAERVAERVQGWVKYFGFVVALPVALVLTVIGIKTASDLWKLDAAVSEARTGTGELLDRVGKDNKVIGAAEKSIAKLDPLIAAVAKARDDAATALGDVAKARVAAAKANEQFIVESTKLAKLDSQVNVQFASVQGLIGALGAAARDQARSAIGAPPITKIAGTAPVSLPGGRLVFIQYADKTVRAVLDRVRTQLIDGGFVAPGLQLLDRRYFELGNPDEVKYFHAEDRALADRVAGIVNKELADICSNPPKLVVPSKAAYAKNPDATTQLEVWLRSGCNSPSQVTPPGRASWEVTLSTKGFVDISGAIPQHDQIFTGCVVEASVPNAQVNFGYVQGGARFQALVLAENKKACVTFSFNGNIAHLGAQLLTDGANAHIKIWPTG